MGLQVWLPLNKDTNVIPGISSFSKEGSVTFTEDTDGWYKVVDSSHTSSRWGIYYNFDVKPSTTYTLTVYSKSTTGVPCSIGIGSFQGVIAWPAVRDTNNTSTEKLTTYTWTTTQNDTKARIYLAMNPGSTVANNYVFYKEPKVCEALTSQGLSNVTVTNNGATVDNNGKIGKCYSFNGTTSRLSLSSLTFSFPLSICAWVKFNNATDTNTEYIFSYNTDSGGTSGHNIGFGLYGGKLSIWHGGKVNSYSANLSNNIWYHVTAVVTSSNYKLYLNGEEILSASYAHNSVSSKWITLGARSNSSTGGIGSALYFFNGYLSDARFYNHALSSQEVKLLSQGLILHYPLDRNGWGQENLATCTTPVYNIAASASSQYNYIWINNNTLEPNTTYTFSAEVTVSDFNKCTVYNYTASGKSGSINHNFPADGKRHSWTFTTTSNAIGFIAYAGNSGATSGHSAVYKNIKIEKGNKATPYSPRAAESLYTAMDIGGTTEYDISGYQNNGVRTGTFSWNTDSPKYSTSQVFSGSQYIVEPNEINTTDSTISLWIKSALAGNCHVLDARNSSEIGKQPIYQYTNGSIQTGGNNKYVTTNTGLLVANTWVHIVLVQDGNSLLVYKNGNLFQTLSCTNSPIIKPTVGARLNFANKYTGQLSDVRIYVTALSADDVLDLYNNKL